MKKVLFVATVVKTHIMEFHIPFLKMFKEEGWETAVAARNDYELTEKCDIPYCDNYYDISFARNPLNPLNLQAYKALKKIIEDGNYDIIHCHTPVGGLLTRMAARNARKSGTRVIYTAHGFHFFDGAPLINWLIYYPVERVMAHYTDDLITINSEDYERAQSFKAKRVHYVPGVGIDIKSFSPDFWQNKKNKMKKRNELDLKENDFVIVSVGELIKRKNHKAVIYAIAQIKQQSLQDYERIQYLICGSGILEEKLKKLARDLNVEKHIHFMGYRNDICEIYQASDLFIFVSLQEGLPVAMMEAMACGLPVIGSDIRGNKDLVINGKNGILIDNSIESVREAIIESLHGQLLIENDVEERIDYMKRFSLSNVEKQMYKIYFR